MERERQAKLIEAKQKLDVKTKLDIVIQGELNKENNSDIENFELELK